MEHSKFKDLKYNVFKLDEGQSVFDKWPRLKKTEEYNVNFGLDQETVMRYIMIFYDKNSPLVKTHPDPKKAKGEAARLAGFKQLKNKRFTKTVEKMLRGGNEKVNTAAIIFSKEGKSNLWMTYCAVVDKHVQNLWEINNADDPNKKLTIESIIKDSERIDQLRDKFINYDPSEEMQERVFDFAVQDVELRPEQIAQRVEDGEMVVDMSPYEYEDE